MEQFKAENLSFTYPTTDTEALSNINFTVNKGEFITIFGESGCGKTTLLRMLKPSLTPHGKVSGQIFFAGKPLSHITPRDDASKIGFVMQNPESQIVTDKVWHELAFGLESLGLPTSEIRTRVSEMASYFGIHNMFRRDVSELSGGQMQLLNLASVMAMQPEALILDEPTSQLDPIAAQEFIRTLEKINRDFGTTVIISEHRLEDAFPVSDRCIVMADGKIIAEDTPQKIGTHIKGMPIYNALPAVTRIYGEADGPGEYPVTVREGRLWLETCEINTKLTSTELHEKPTEMVIEAKDLRFRYEKNLPDVIRGVNIKIGKGEHFAILGGNGSGKSTLLSLFSGIHAPISGKIRINGKPLNKKTNLYNGLLGVLPQSPQALFVKKTVGLDLEDMTDNTELIKQTAELCRITHLLNRHPYDLSGGEQQRAALAKVLLTKPKILILDEPTKGMDAGFKKTFGELLGTLAKKGITIITVSHDIEFCARYASRCGLMFDGEITAMGTPREFFAGNSFYTTAANKIARDLLPFAVLPEDVIEAVKGANK